MCRPARWSAILLGLALWQLGGAAFAQTPAEELDVLRAHLALAPDTQIALSSSASIPARKTIRVFLGFGLDVGIYDNFRGWIESWNKKKSRKYGSLQIVDKVENADLVFARFLVREAASESIESHPTVRTVPVFNWQTNQMELQNVAGTATTTAATAPVYAYALLRQGDGWSIVSRYTSKADLNETGNSGRQLWENVERLLKGRQVK